MSGIIAVYALVIAVLIAGDIGPPPGQEYSLYRYISIVSLAMSGPIQANNC